MNNNMSPIDKFLLQFDARFRFLALIVIGLVILAWTGLLDKPSTEYVDQTLIRASLSFGAARALNSVVSVLQSTTFSINVLGGMSLTGGEVLDPINDLVEQYSTLMKFSIGSLLIQKVLIDIVSDNTFNILLTLAGGFAIHSIVFAKHSLLPLALKAFFFTAFLRFLLIVTLLLNSLISNSFIEPQTNSDVSNLEQLTAEVEEMSEEGRLTKDQAAAQLPQQQQQKIQLQNTRDELESELEVARQEFQQAQEEYDSSLGDGVIRSFVERFRSDDQEVIEARENRDLYRQEFNIKQDQINQLDTELSELSNSITRNENVIAGRPNSWVDSIGTTYNRVANRVNPSTVRDRIEESSTNILRVMSLFIFETLLMPLLFLYFLSRGMKGFWNVNFMDNMSQRDFNIK